MANLTDADKVLRNDTGKDIVTQLTAIKTAIENGGGGGGGASTVSQLTDVLLSSEIPDGDVLVRDNNLTGGKLWKNATITVELTQAEYNQLVEDDEVLPDVNYYITDAPSMQGTSADLSYDGTTLSTHDKIEGLNASDLPISSSDTTNTKDYIDTNCLTVTSPSGVTRNTTTTSSGTFDVSKCGKLVTVNILEIVSSTVYGQNELVISGLPIPSTSQGFMLSNNGDQKAYRFRITTSGELRAWYNSPGVPSGASLYGFITYFTA